MSRKYKFRNPEGIYFISYAVVGWIDIFTRPEYKNIVVDSLIYCQKEKGLELFAWCIMTNHVHLIARAKNGFLMQDIIRDMKKFTSKKLFLAIEENPKESRKAWIISIFKRAGEYNSNNTYFQVWRQDNHPIELASNAEIDRRLNYLHNNPVKAGIVEHPEDYKYSSAKNFCGATGLIEIDPI